MRQVILDTETTGLDPHKGHRIIEIGCVELIDRKRTGNELHQYLQPDRKVDAGAIEVHGITNEFLEDKPKFADIVDDFLAYIKGSQLIIHNAPFDVGFINAELKLTGRDLGDTSKYCEVIDSLVMARHMRPGQKNSLDALCRHFNIDNSQRELHGALLDAELLAEVYLALTGGQSALFLENEPGKQAHTEKIMRQLDANRPVLPIIHASDEEQLQHEAWLDELDSKTAGKCLWRMEC
ncbi:DNA polymerase III subunit epsilon [bacterium BMS3Bbin11]|nr:DNA polymerase III subunit epsilon [bacterium BMS3Abin11]GBE45895.1 DNA polymerase III subunit epsilon [bacterium BMS3Bbin11]GMT39739.1 MAG: DNA polymerase III subunit epsilon [bacterium]HDH08042.1 DNA polymerase III subunit epsilon [Gammaproteobacteria bacterium]HDH17101.1 DNA polymerase III subunit epsilon [Gammaproteobacteria bacterium]